MKSARFYVLMILVLAGCAAPRVFVPPPARVTAPPELLRSDYLCEVLRYLNQWELDEVNRLPAPGSGEVEIWVRPVPVKTDEGDRSSFAEMWFPGPRLLLHLKRSDADLPERHSRRQDACYKIRAVERGGDPPVRSLDWDVVRLPSRETAVRLEQMGPLRWTANTAVEERLRALLSDYLRMDPANATGRRPVRFDAAPPSPVSSRLWVYWDNRKTALCVPVDGDLEDSRSWDHLHFQVRLVPLGGWAGAGTARPSRDWSARLLYNCLLLGRPIYLERP